MSIYISYRYTYTLTARMYVHIWIASASTVLEFEASCCLLSKFPTGKCPHHWVWNFGQVSGNKSPLSFH